MAKNHGFVPLALKEIFGEEMTAEEAMEWNELNSKMKYHKDLPDRFKDLHWVAREVNEFNNYPGDRIWDKVTAGIKREKTRVVYWKTAAAVAAAAVFLGTGFYLYKQHPVAGKGASPGVAVQPGRPVYNTLRTKKNFPTILHLSDGSRVELNAATTIRYPDSFPGKTRNVELSGEAEFNIVADPSKPFQVTVEGFVVEVLGTHLSIMAYPDEPEKKITLLDGSIRVRGEKNNLLLTEPAEARMDSTGFLHKDTIPNIEAVLEWKDRKFHFDDKKPLTQVLREIARWYDLKLPSLDGVDEKPISAIYERSLPATMILQGVQDLEDDRIQFTVKGDSILIHMNR